MNTFTLSSLDLSKIKRLTVTRRRNALYTHIRSMLDRGLDNCVLCEDGEYRLGAAS